MNSNADAGVGNLEDLNRFVRDLERYRDQLIESTDTAARSFNYVTNTWQDKQQQKFAMEFDQAINGIKKMVSLVENHSKWVRTKANILAAYVGR